MSLNNHWVQFDVTVLNGLDDEPSRRQIKKIFYSGAVAMYRLLTEAAKVDDLSDVNVEKAMQAIESVESEVNQFINEEIIN